MAQKMEHKLPDAACLWPASGKTACDTLRLALELSTLAYDMDVAKYLDDGWQDVSFSGGYALAYRLCFPPQLRAGSCQGAQPYGKEKSDQPVSRL